MPSTAVPTVTTGTRRSRSETNGLVGQRNVQRQQAVDPFGQRSGVQTAGAPTTGHPDRVQQQVVALLREDLLGALDDGREEPPGHPGRDDADGIGSSGGQGGRRRRREVSELTGRLLRPPARVVADTPGSPRSARDTVAGENPDSAATSTMPAGSKVGPDMSISSDPGRSALDASGQQASDEVALQADEHDQRNDDRDERTGGQQFPLIALGARQLRNCRGDRPQVRARREHRAPPAGRSTPTGTGRSPKAAMAGTSSGSSTTKKIFT